MQQIPGWRMSASDNVLTALSLFTPERPEWTVEQAAEALGVSGSTAYRYFSGLSRFDLITQSGAGRYVLGPAIIALDRQIRLRDPLLGASEPVMRRLIRHHRGEGIALLCRSFRGHVMCVHQAYERRPDHAVSYERGRPMGLYRGAASLVILAHLPLRALRKLWDAQANEITAAGHGESWNTFLASLKRLRAEEAVVTHAQLDPGMVGIAAPILHERQVLGSVSLVLPEHSVSAEEIAALATHVRTAAREIEAALDEHG